MAQSMWNSSSLNSRGFIAKIWRRSWLFLRSNTRVPCRCWIDRMCLRLVNQPWTKRENSNELSLGLNGSKNVWSSRSGHSMIKVLTCLNQTCSDCANHNKPSTSKGVGAFEPHLRRNSGSKPLQFKIFMFQIRCWHRPISIAPGGTGLIHTRLDDWIAWSCDKWSHD